MLLNKYLWILDTLHRYGSLTLARLNEKWVLDQVDDGQPLPRRTFMTYRNKIEEMFNINIVCNRSTFEYRIEDDHGNDNSRINWMLDSMSISGTLQNTQSIASRVLLEDVPSARRHLAIIVDAIKQSRCIRFDYSSYTRANTSRGVEIQPYFVRIFKQLWYVVGNNPKDGKIKTYALDRMDELTIMADKTFTMPADFSPREYFRDSYGIITNDNVAKEIRLRVNAIQAKYIRALPLHHTQQEELAAGGFSIFTYKMKVTYDLRERLLSMGSNIEVLSPPELKLQIKEELKRALDLYN
ncbi:MAG: WYL domain-containing protein [Bacteroidales bacterium]|nr:WYL domain-containing protein [Candidatus Sodaliphilus aphodohippi]